MNLTREAATLVRCECGALASWIAVEEDPAVEQPGPYQAQVCAGCGASLQPQWRALHSRALARTSGTTRSVFPRVLLLAGIGGFIGAFLSAMLFDVSPVTRAMGGAFGFLVCAGVVVVIGNQFPGILSFWWGFGHGRCPCGNWLRERDRVDGFVNPETPDDEHQWIAIWKCPACDALLRSEVVLGSFV